MRHRIIEPSGDAGLRVTGGVLVVLRRARRGVAGALHELRQRRSRHRDERHVLRAIRETSWASAWSASTLVGNVPRFRTALEPLADPTPYSHYKQKCE